MQKFGYFSHNKIKFYGLNGNIGHLGVMTLSNTTSVEWDDYSEAIPAFITMFLMPLSYSISDRIMLGIITYVLIEPVAPHHLLFPGDVHNCDVVRLFCIGAEPAYHIINRLIVYRLRNSVQLIQQKIKTQ